MAPKFRGDSEDWLDDEAVQGNVKAAIKPKKARGRAAPLLWEQANGIVVEVFPKQCKVRMEEGAEILCSYRRAEVISESQKERERSPVAVGDRVLARTLSPDAGVVEGICARKNSLVRPAPDQASKKIRHVVAANVDVLVIVASVERPKFSPGLVDRYLVAAQASGIYPLICLNKIDLLSEGEEKPWNIYRDLGFDEVRVSAKRGNGMEELRGKLLEQWRGKTIVFCGQSGVGKTSLLRTFLGVEIGKIGEVSDATGKGRHTTTGAILLQGPAGCQWIDTPGIREFGLLGVEPESLAGFFPEFARLECSRSGCFHVDEEGCQATELPRYPSYRRLFESLRAGEF